MRMPPVRVRLASEAGFLVLVAVGLALAGFDPIVIGAVMFIGLILVALYERSCSKAAARTAAEREPTPEPPPRVERAEVEPTAVTAKPEPEPEREPEPEPTVNERSARSILASAPPPLPPEPPKQRKPARRRLVTRAAPAPPEPEPEPEAPAAPPHEWNLWDLQRAVRDAPDEERHEEWTALLIHLREFANADGDLPLEFDGLVRESFGPVLDPEREPAAAP